MGQGGFLTVMNTTLHDWKRGDYQSRQMVSWVFPEIIHTGECVTLYIEYDQGLFMNESNDFGTAGYFIGDTGHTFGIQARAPDNNFQLHVILDNFGTPTLKPKSDIILGWEHDGNVFFSMGMGGKEEPFQIAFGTKARKP